MDTPLKLGSTNLAKPFLVRLGAGVLILNLFVISMGAISIRQGWRSRQSRAVATAQNLAQVLDHNMADTFAKADLAVWAVKDEAERTLASPGGSRSDLDAFIRRQQERIPGLVALRTTDAQGVIDHESGAALGSRANLSDREYFTRLRDAPDTGLVISRPLVGKAAGTWLIAVARRLERPDRGFAGVVFATIPLSQIDQAFSSLDLGPHGSVALRDLDMGLIARHPEPIRAGTAIGEKVVSQELLAFLRSGRSSGDYRARTPFDRVQRTFAIRRVTGQPFYLLVGLAEQDYLAGWRRETLQESMELGLFVSLTLVAYGLIRRAWLRQQAAHAELEKLLTEVKTLGGMLPICSHCKKIRDDQGYWNQLETYIQQHSGAEFTHGLCPDCVRLLYPDFAAKRLGQKG